MIEKPKPPNCDSCVAFFEFDSKPDHADGQCRLGQAAHWRAVKFDDWCGQHPLFDLFKHEYMDWMCRPIEGEE